MISLAHRQNSELLQRLDDFIEDKPKGPMSEPVVWYHLTSNKLVDHSCAG